MLQLWDANKIVLVEQGLLKKDDPLVKANSRNSKNDKTRNISISREQVYIGEICRHLAKLKTLDHDELFTRFGEKLQYSNKNCGNFQTFSFDLGTEKSLRIDMDDTSGLEDRIASKVVFRLTEILDDRLKDIQGLASRVLELETNLLTLTNSFKLTKTQLDQRISEKIKSPDLSKLSVTQKEMDKGIDKLEKLRVSLEKDLREAALPARTPQFVPRTEAAPPTTSRFQVWGRGADKSGAPNIPRVFNFVVSKIPNKTEFSTDWLKAEEQRIFRDLRLQATIIEVEKMKASFQGARTKSFKVLVMTEDKDVTLEKFLNPHVWVNGVSVSKYKRPKNPQFNDGATGAKDYQNLHEQRAV